MKRILMTLNLFLIVFWFIGCNFSGKVDEKRAINKELFIILPKSATVIEYEDSHGGFLGDGVLKATVKIEDDEESREFINTLKEKWEKLPFENTTLNNVLNERYFENEFNDEIPYSEDYYYFYLNRYESEDISYIQNFTIGVLMEDKNELFVYVSDM